MSGFNFAMPHYPEILLPRPQYLERPFIWFTKRVQYLSILTKTNLAFFKVGGELDLGLPCEIVGTGTNQAACYLIFLMAALWFGSWLEEGMKSPGATKGIP